MKVLVTGANGLLGHHVVFELLKRKYDVHILVRNLSAIYFDLGAVTVFEGNFQNKELVSIAASECDAIVHIAAVTATNLLRYEDYSEVNVDGTQTLLSVANSLSIKKIIFVSTTNTIGYGTKAIKANENSAFQFPFTESFYAQSKIAAETICREASLLPDRHIIIINPAFMIGAFDTKPSSGKLMIMGYKNALMFVPKGGKNFVAASDVAIAISNALEQGRNGERYLATGVNLSFRQFYTLQKKIGNYRQIIIELPDFLLLGIAKIGDMVRKMNRKSDLSTRNIRQLVVQEFYSNKKAINELNMSQTSIEVAIEEALNWFKERKML